MKSVFFVLLILLAAGPVFAVFDQSPGSAAGRGMGDALYASPDGLEGLNYNPAAIAYARSIQMQFSADTPLTAASQAPVLHGVSGAFLIPFFWWFTIQPDQFFTKRAALAFQYNTTLLTHDLQPGDYYQKGTYALTYSKNLDNILLDHSRAAAGFRFIVSDTGMAGASDAMISNGLSFGMDFGLTYHIFEDITLGLFWKNLGGPVVVLQNGQRDKKRIEFGLGLGTGLSRLFSFRDNAGLFYNTRLNFGLVSYEHDCFNLMEPDAKFSIGLEFSELAQKFVFSQDRRSTNDMLKIRAGLKHVAYHNNQFIDLSLFKLYGTLSATAGLGLTYAIAGQVELALDYSAEYQFNDSALRHSAGLSMKYLLNNMSYWATDEQYYRELYNFETEQEQSNAKPSQPVPVPEAGHN